MRKIWILLLLVLLVLRVKSDKICNEIKDRVDCSSGVGENKENVILTKRQCENRGCCWDDVDNECFYKVEGVPVKTVHVINSNHFDAGYASLTADVINLYFDEFYPRAANVGSELRKKNHGPLRWMTFSYLISLFFDCPPNMNLHCPNQTNLDLVSNAVLEEDIVWPAFPHNAELSTGDSSFLKFGVELSRSLATKLNGSIISTSVLSTRDVPGMPRASLFELQESGVQALSEGMNGRMLPVNVPPAFLWRNGNVTMPTLWHWHGYGSLGDPGDPIRIPGSSDALAYCWRGDNEGPPLSADEVLNNTIKLKQIYAPSQVQVISSTLGDYVKALKEQNAWKNLPVITRDLSDTWIWGVASDPVKTQRMRSITRARAACEKNSKSSYCSKNDVEFFNFSRLALKNMEHTWGESVFHYGNESDKDWSNVEFHARLDQNQSNFVQFVKSWKEQREFGIDIPITALSPNHEVRKYLEADFKDLSNYHINLTNMIRTYQMNDLSLGHYFTVSIANDGSIVELKNINETTSLVSSEHPLGLFRYQTIVKSDLDTWRQEYLIPGSGGYNEYGMPDSFMNGTSVESFLESARVQSVYSSSQEILIELAFENTDLHEKYGAPETVWICYTAKSLNTIGVRLVILNKTATRLPEATWFTFNSAAGREQQQWEHNILGEWQNPTDVQEGASFGLHYVSDEGVRTNNMQILPYDAGLLRWTEPFPFPTPINISDDTAATFLKSLHANGASFNLHNNIWHTNYPAWMPFDSLGKNLVFRFDVRLL